MSLSQTDGSLTTPVENFFKTRRLVRSCKGNALAGALAGLVVVAGILASSGPVSLPTSLAAVHGTITKIDAPALRLQMQSDTGLQMQLAVVNVDALRTVRRGEHVRVDIDDHGAVLNIRATPLMPYPVSYSRG